MASDVETSRQYIGLNATCADWRHSISGCLTTEIAAASINNKLSGQASALGRVEARSSNAPHSSG